MRSGHGRTSTSATSTPTRKAAASAPWRARSSRRTSTSTTSLQARSTSGGTPSAGNRAHAATRPHQCRGRPGPARDSAPCRLPGGTLLAQVARNIGPLKDALQTAIDYVQTFATSPDAGVTAPEVGSGVHEAGGRLDGEDASGGQGDSSRGRTDGGVAVPTRTGSAPAGGTASPRYSCGCLWRQRSRRSVREVSCRTSTSCARPTSVTQKPPCPASPDGRVSTCNGW